MNGTKRFYDLFSSEKRPTQALRRRFLHSLPSGLKSGLQSPSQQRSFRILVGRRRAPKDVFKPHPAHSLSIWSKLRLPTGLRALGQTPPTPLTSPLGARAESSQAGAQTALKRLHVRTLTASDTLLQQQIVYGRDEHRRPISPQAVGDVPPLHLNTAFPACQSQRLQ